MGIQGEEDMKGCFTVMRRYETRVPMLLNIGKMLKRGVKEFAQICLFEHP